jgi:hypothetical protein
MDCRASLAMTARDFSNELKSLRHRELGSGVAIHPSA